MSDPGPQSGTVNFQVGEVLPTNPELLPAIVFYLISGDTVSPYFCSSPGVWTLINSGGDQDGDVSQSLNIKQTEIDFGPLPVSEAIFIIVDSSVTPSSNIIGQIAYVAPTNKDLDEVEMDTIDLKFSAGNGQFVLYAISTYGYVADKFKINYLVT